MRRGFRPFLVIVALGLFLSTAIPKNGGAEDPPPAERHQKSGPSSPRLIVFLIDFNAFLCPSCLDSFLHFHKKLEARVNASQMWGILMIDHPFQESKKETKMKILHKKLRGFKKANHIKFPILIDHLGVFRGWSKEGTAIILLDGTSQKIRKYNFPLTPQEMREIIDHETVH